MFQQVTVVCHSHRCNHFDSNILSLTGVRALNIYIRHKLVLYMYHLYLKIEKSSRGSTVTTYMTDDGGSGLHSGKSTMLLSQTYLRVSPTMTMTLKSIRHLVRPMRSRQSLRTKNTTKRLEKLQLFSMQPCLLRVNVINCVH